MERTFETPRPLRLDLRLPSGQIAVEAAETATTDVRLDGPDDLLARATVELRGDELRVDVRDRKGIFGAFGRDQVALTVRCPAGSSLTARAASADVEASGQLAAAKVQTASGDVRLEQAAGELSVQTASGDVEVGRAGGSLTVQAVSGDVRVREADPPFLFRNVRDDVIKDALEGLGATVNETTAPFEPLHDGHSGHGHAHDHHHDHGHGHSHGDHGHGERDKYGRLPGDPHYGHNHA